jgi:hypothetical protein
MARDIYLPKSSNGLRSLLRRRPVVLWLVLVLAFFMIWRFLNTTAPGGSGTAPATPDQPRAPEPSFPLPAIVAGVALLGGLGWGWWLRSRVRAFNAECAEALKLFAAADYRGATARFEDLARRFPRPRQARATARFNLAMGLLRSGELERARVALAALDPTLAAGAPSLRPTAAAQLAAIYALRGDPQAADQWIAEARARAKAVGTTRAIDGAIAFARAVNDIRRDNYDQALRDLDAAWSDLEGALVAAELRPFRALRAFAAARGDLARAGAAGVATPSADARPGELAWMGVEWPEMRAFLEAR